MAKFDIDRVIWGRDSSEVKEGTFVLAADTIEDLQSLIEEEKWVKAGIFYHSTYCNKAGRAQIIDMFNYLGHKLEKQFIYAIDKSLDKDIDRYIERAIDEVNYNIKITKENEEIYEREGLHGYTQREVKELEHKIEVLNIALNA